MSNPFVAIGAGIKKLISSIPGIRSSPGKRGGTSLRGRIIENWSPREVINFGSFLALPFPDISISGLASSQQTKQLFREIAEQVRTALTNAGRENCSLVELYTPAPTWMALATLLSTPARISQFEEICTTEVFGARATATSAGNQLPPRVYLVRRPLSFDPAFDKILQSKLLVRPLGEGGVSIPTDPDRYYGNADQILLGEIDICDMERNPIANPPIWAWRAVKNELTVAVHADFDVLSRDNKDKAHRFPLGLNVQCTMHTTRRRREMQHVALGIKEAKYWLKHVSEVSYFVETGVGQDFQRYPMEDYPDDAIPIDPDTAVKSYPLGRDENGKEISIGINRELTVIAKSDSTSYIYTFRFFERALKYSPDMNFLRVSGQLIPANGTATVYLPPSLEHEQSPLFELTPKAGTTDRFDLLALNQRLTLNSTILNSVVDVLPGQPQEVKIGDRIEFVSKLAGPTPNEDFSFEIQDLRDVPNEVQASRPYLAFIAIDSNPPRQSQLSAKEHILGTNGFFATGLTGIERDALLFERPYVLTTMRAAPNQTVWYFNKFAAPAASGSPVVQKLDEEGHQLKLNGVYVIYLGDFQLTLNLRCTPASEI